jgi:L,D-peptidoglycan transpeptidase YkuD (ErfK/YbiS/YcfS/YnhG family)
MEVHVQTAQNLAQGEISWAGKTYRCALGRSGIAANKAEGDGVTPCGRFGFRQVFYRPDRRDPPATALPLQELRPEMGWSDDPADGENYNRLIIRPYTGSHERLWRDDHVYDLIVPLGYNDDPVLAGKGSAIFLHLTRPGFPPTAGCVALEQAVMLALLRDLTAASYLQIGGC